MTEQMPKKYKNSDVVKLWRVINELLNSQDKISTKFLLCLMRNKNIIQAEIDTFTELQKPNPEDTKFEDARRNLCERFADKEENGTVITKQNSETGSSEYVMSEENRANFEKEFGTLVESFKESFATAETKQKEFSVLMDNDSIITNFVKISDNELPNTLVAYQIDGLLPILEGF